MMITAKTAATTLPKTIRIRRLFVLGVGDDVRRLIFPNHNTKNKENHHHSMKSILSRFNDLTVQRFNAFRPRFTFYTSRFTFYVSLPAYAITLSLTCILLSAPAAPVTGNLTDISIQPLDTKLLFTPGTNVLLTGTSLSAGPPKMIDTTGGAFSLALEAGDYTVSLPAIPTRAPIRISVFARNATVNISTLLSAPVTYTYTNYIAAQPLRVNTASVTAWSTNAATTLLGGTTTIPSAALVPGRVIILEAFGSISDPAANIPSVSLTLKLGSTTICSQSAPGTTANWHLRPLITVPSAGVSGSVAHGYEGAKMPIGCCAWRRLRADSGGPE